MKKRFAQYIIIDNVLFQKKYKQTLHVEVDLPLLVPDIRYEKPVEKNITDLDPSKSPRSMKSINSKKKTGLGSSRDIKGIKNVNRESKKDSNSSEKVKSTKSLNNKKILKTARRNSPYNRSNEDFNKMCFKTEQKQWSDIIEFAPEYISSPRENSAEIRDTFKTSVTVRIVYLKVRKYMYIYFTNFPKIIAC